jgi:hypothetical protein
MTEMNTIQQPTALKLADVIDAFDQIDESLPLEMLPRLSAELRRLHETNTELLAALEQALPEIDCGTHRGDRAWDAVKAAIDKAAIDKATGETE